MRNVTAVILGGGFLAWLVAAHITTIEDERSVEEARIAWQQMKAELSR